MLSRFRITTADLAALRKSAVFKLWLRKSWAAWVAGLLYSVFAGWIFPAVMRPLLGLIWRPVKGTGVKDLGRALFKGTQTYYDHPTVTNILSVASPLVWLLGFSLLMALLELKIKPAISAARAKSRELEDEAERAMAASPSESVMLLQRAYAHATEPAREEELRRKMIAVDQRLSLTGASLGSSSAPIPIAPVGATMAPEGNAPRRIGVRGRYRLDAELGRGGMGVVWRARDTVLDRDVAMKELPPTANLDLRERFRQEAKALAKLSHPNVVQVYDLVEEDQVGALPGGRIYISMELVEGGDLESLLRTPLSVPRALELGRQIAAGLAFAHKKGIVHRDVKPMNVLVTADGVAKVTDFGLAKLAESTMHTMEGAVLGSPRYMSPEQAAGTSADARSDIYAFGATLFHMLTGKPPFDGDTASVLAQHITQPPPLLVSLNKDVPAPVDALVRRMLAKNPADRPATLDEVEQALPRLSAA